MNIMYIENLPNNNKNVCAYCNICNEKINMGFYCYDGSINHPLPITKYKNHNFGIFFICDNHIKEAIDEGYDTVTKYYFIKIFNILKDKIKIQSNILLYYNFLLK